MFFNQNLFNLFAVDNNVFIFDEVVLSSGRKSNFYDRWREICGDVATLERISGYIIDKVDDMKWEVDSFYGVPEGATSLGVITQYFNAERQGICYESHVLPVGRKFSKKHGAGEENFVVKPRGKTVVLENIVTTGGSVLKELDKLEKANVDVVGVIALTDRMQVNDDRKSVEELFAKKGVNYAYLSDALTLLPELYDKLKPGRGIKRKLIDEFKKYGVKSIKF